MAMQKMRNGKLVELSPEEEAQLTEANAALRASAQKEQALSEWKENRPDINEVISALCGVQQGRALSAEESKGLSDFLAWKDSKPS